MVYFSIYFPILFLYSLGPLQGGHDRSLLQSGSLQLPTIGTFGTTPRGFMRGPGAQTFDLSMMKGFALTEKTRLQFRAEFFNAFNHANFSSRSRR